MTITCHNTYYTYYTHYTYYTLLHYTHYTCTTIHTIHTIHSIHTILYILYYTQHTILYILYILYILHYSILYILYILYSIHTLHHPSIHVRSENPSFVLTILNNGTTISCIGLIGACTTGTYTLFSSTHSNQSQSAIINSNQSDHRTSICISLFIHFTRWPQDALHFITWAVN